MAYIRRSRLWTDPRVKPPFGVARFNYSSRLARGIRGAWLVHDSGKLVRDYARKFHGTVLTNGGVKWVPDRSGGSAASFYNNGSSRGEITLPALGLSGNQPYTMFVLWRRIGTGLQYRLGGWGTQGTRTGFGVASPTTTTLRHFWWTADQPDVTVPSLTGRLVAIAASWDGTTRRTYHAGTLGGSDTPAAPNLTDSNYAIGNTAFDSINADQEIHAFYIWSRALSSHEIAWLSREPYVMFRPVLQQRFYPAVAPPPPPPPVTTKAGSLENCGHAIFAECDSWLLA